MMSAEQSKQAVQGPSFWWTAWSILFPSLRFHALYSRWELGSDVLPWYALIGRARNGNAHARRLLKYFSIITLSTQVVAAAVLSIALYRREGMVDWHYVACAPAGAFMALILVGLYDVRAGVSFSVAFGPMAAFVCGWFPGQATLSTFVKVWSKVALVPAVIGFILILIMMIDDRIKKPDNEKETIHSLLWDPLLAGIVTGFVVLGVGIVPGICFLVRSNADNGARAAFIGGFALAHLAACVAGGVGLGVSVLSLAGFWFAFGEDGALAALFAVLIVAGFYWLAPGLRIYLHRACRSDIVLAQELLQEVTADGPAGLARAVLAEQQTRSLVDVARSRQFARVVNFDLPFFSRDTKVPADSPLYVFRLVARDLATKGMSLRRRYQALSRATEALDKFCHEKAKAAESDSILQLHLDAAHVWLTEIDVDRSVIAEQLGNGPDLAAVFVAGPPLDPDRAESQTLFKVRDDLVKLIDHDLAVGRRGLLVLFGQRRMGKTSLRMWLSRRLSDTKVIEVDFQHLSGEPNRRSPHRLVVETIASKLPIFGVPDVPESDAWVESIRWLELVEKALGDARVLVAIDEVERVEDGIREGWCSTEFLDFIRAVGDRFERIRFVVLTAYPPYRLGPHWVDRLVSATTRTISYLDEEDARELIVEPVPDFPAIYPDGGVDRILRETGRHPFLIQKVCDELCRRLDMRGGTKATEADLTEAFDAVLRGAELFDELWRQRNVEEKSVLQLVATATEPVAPDVVARQLVREGYLQLEGNQLRMAVPLFGAWIADTVGAP